MEVLILLGLIVLNGVFAMSEIALVTARKARLMKRAEEGDKSAAVALKLGEDPTRFLSTIQIGITSIGLLNGIVGDAVLADPLEEWLVVMGMQEKTAAVTATAVVVVLVTYISIVVGELVPKRIGQISAERIARLVARPMQILAQITAPFVQLLSISTRGLLRLLRVKPSPTTVSEEEIVAMLQEGSEAGIFELPEHEMVRNVFRLDDRRVVSLMIPRSDVIFLDVNAPWQENLQRLIESGHSRLPVCDGTLDKLLGVVQAKQILLDLAKGNEPDFRANLKPAIFVLERLTALELLEEFRKNNTEIAFVIDEYGGIDGMVTLRDVMATVTGELILEDDEEAWAIARDDGSWLLEGAIPIPELKDRLELRTVPEEDKGRYHTLGGMILLLLGRIPNTGDRVRWEGWSFEVVDMDGKRIDKVLAKPLANAEVELGVRH